MTNNIELLSQYDNYTIGTNSNLTEILANVVKVGTDTSNVTISIPQDINSSYNLILPVRQGASGESLVYGADGQLVWHDPTVLKQIVPIYGATLTGNLVSAGTHSSPTYLENYTANITPMSANSKIFVQFKVNYHAALSYSNQISFYIKKTYDGNETIYSESLLGPYNAAGGFTGQYISNLVDESNTTSTISYQLGYQINGTVDISDTLGILGYDTSYNNTILLQEFEGSGSNSISVWNKGSDNNGLYYSSGTVHIGSTKDALDSQNTPGVALELSGNLVGTGAIFSGNITAVSFIGDGSQLTGISGISGGANLNEFSDASFNNVDISGNLTGTFLTLSESLDITNVCEIKNVNSTDTDTYYDWTQKGDRFNSLSSNSDFGNGIALDSTGTIIAIGAPGDDVGGTDYGTVRVYKYEPTMLGWTQLGDNIYGEANLASNNSNLTNINFGNAVSLSSDGTILAIGARGYDTVSNTDIGYVKIYQYSSVTETWSQYGNTIIGESAGEQFGGRIHLASNGNTILIGASLNSDPSTKIGRARVYDYSSGSWTKRGSDLVGEAQNDEFGWDVSISSNGNIIAIGATMNDGNGNESGHVRVYEWSVAGSAWVQKGSDIDGEASDNYSGVSISLSSDGLTIAIGAQPNSGAYEYSGHVRIYEWSGSAWVQKGADIDGEEQYEFIAITSLSADGNKVVVSSIFSSGGGISRGVARIYEWSGTSWQQKGSSINGKEDYDSLGLNAKINSNGDIVAISAYKMDYNTNEANPYVEVYQIGTQPIGYNGSQAKFYDNNAIIRSFNNSNNGGILTMLTRENNGSLTEKLRIDSTGNIGVGKQQPSEKLDVNGSIKANTIIGKVVGEVTGDVVGNLYGSMTMTGNIIPNSDSAYDIGSARRKIRHMYISQNSLWIGDEYKLTISPTTQDIVFKKRKKDSIPASFSSFTEEQILTIFNDIPPHPGTLSSMTLYQWSIAAERLGLNIDTNDIFDNTIDSDWETILDIQSISTEVTNLQTDNTTIKNALNQLLTASGMSTI